MKRKGLIVLVAMLAVMLSSLSGCQKYEQIRIVSGNVESVNMNGFKSVDMVLSVKIDNPAGKVKVKSAEGTLKHFGKVIGKVTLAPMILPARSVSECQVEAHVELAAGLGLKDILKLMDPKRLDEFVVDLSFAGTASGVAVKRNINDIPLKKLLESNLNEKV